VRSQVRNIFAVITTSRRRGPYLGPYLGPHLGPYLIDVGRYGDEAVVLTWEERDGQMGGTAPDSTTKYATTANSTATTQDTTGRHVNEVGGRCRCQSMKLRVEYL